MVRELAVLVLLCSLALVTANEYNERVSAYLNALRPVVESQLEPNERLIIWYEGFMTSWYKSPPDGIEWSKNYFKNDTDPKTLLSFSDIYMNWIPNEVDVVTLGDTASKCLNTAFDRIAKYMDAETNGTHRGQVHRFYTELDHTEWQKRFEAGLYGKTGYKVKYAWSGGETVQEAEAITRVSVVPGSWYHPAFLQYIRRGRVIGNGVCSHYKTIDECFFQEGGGEYMTSITTGFLVSGNLKQTTTVPNGNSTTTSQPGIPMIMAWIVKPVPETHQLCECTPFDPSDPKETPCYGKKYLDPDAFVLPPLKGDEKPTQGNAIDVQ